MEKQRQEKAEETRLKRELKDRKLQEARDKET